MRITMLNVNDVQVPAYKADTVTFYCFIISFNNRLNAFRLWLLVKDIRLHMVDEYRNM
jgi:hypothetical protein